MVYLINNCIRSRTCVSFSSSHKHLCLHIHTLKLSSLEIEYYVEYNDYSSKESHSSCLAQSPIGLRMWGQNAPLKYFFSHTPGYSQRHSHVITAPPLVPKKRNATLCWHSPPGPRTVWEELPSLLSTWTPLWWTLGEQPLMWGCSSTDSHDSPQHSVR